MLVHSVRSALICLRLQLVLLLQFMSRYIAAD